MYKIRIVLIFTAMALVVALADENKWIWNNDDGVGGESRNRDERRARYFLNEHVENFDYGYGPIRPPFNGQHQEEILVGPGGPTGIVSRPHGNILNGNLVRLGGSHYQNFEICKCAYSFNCPATGLSFGSCFNGKRYCCYSSNKFSGLTPEENPSQGFRASYPGRPNFRPENFLPPNYY